MNEIALKRRWIDVMKGIGILWVVIGHVPTDRAVFGYIYSYHLALFFFLSGLTYNESKYGNAPFQNLGNRIKSNWPRYIIYAGIFGLLHNLLIDLNIYNVSIQYWDGFSFRNYMLNSFVMTNSEPLFGAMWFVPPLILGSGIFGGFIYITNRVSTDNRVKLLLLVLLCFIACLIGNERMQWKYILPYRLDVALFVMPIFLVAYLFGKKYCDNLKRVLKWYIALIFFAISVYLVAEKEWFISLGDQNVTFWRFYILSFIGIYQAMWLAYIVNSKFDILAKLLQIIGQSSFEIMAFHFLAFKFVDVLYVKIMGINDYAILEKIPTTYDNMSLIYVVVGVALPTIFALISKKLGKFVENRKNSGMVSV